MLISFPDKTKDIVKEFNTFEKEKGIYSVKFNISFGPEKIHHYFLLHNVDIFYLHHLERRPEIRGKEFKFHGTIYKYSEDTCKCEIIVPSSAANYFRCGDDWFEYVLIPDKYNNLRKEYHPRQKTTIKEDNPAKDFLNHVAKYKAFCTVPDHANYQRVIHNCFNLYFPFEWQAESGEFDITLDFIKHIFGNNPVEVKEGVSVPNWELGLDYIQILYKYPQQILPILSLVSEERQTGKSTFLKWLNLVFTQNMVIVGNEDLGEKFNAHWASKLIIACDETKIDKHIVMEKVKSLSTANNIMMNAKSKAHINVDFFGKFILCSNNEDNFATIDKSEIRFWVIKVPTIPVKNNVDLLEEMEEEIPAFIHFLNSRKLVTERKERHWFETRLLRTEALEKVVNNSRSNMEKLIKISIAELFDNDNELTEITIPGKALVNEVLKKPNDKKYIYDTLRKMGYEAKPSQRLFYPRIVEVTTETGYQIKTIPISFHSTYYRFLRSDFIDKEESEAQTNPISTDLPF